MKIGIELSVGRSGSPLYHLTSGPSVSRAIQGTSKQYNGMENIFKILNHKIIRNQVVLCLIEGRFTLIMLLGRERQLKDFKWEPLPPPLSFSIPHIRKTISICLCYVVLQ